MHIPVFFRYLCGS